MRHRSRDRLGVSNLENGSRLSKLWNKKKRVRIKEAGVRRRGNKIVCLLCDVLRNPSRLYLGSLIIQADKSEAGAQAPHGKSAFAIDSETATAR